jgi:hypothetical protein
VRGDIVHDFPTRNIDSPAALSSALAADPLMTMSRARGPFRSSLDGTYSLAPTTGGNGRFRYARLSELGPPRSGYGPCHRGAGPRVTET